MEPWTDEPARRFADGAVLRVRRPTGGPAPSPSSVTVSTSRWHQGRLLVAFDDVADRTAAEALRGLELSVLVAPDERPDDPDEYYDHQLIGLSVTTTEGGHVGVVVDVMHSGAQDLLVVRRSEGDPAEDALVPFVTALVPEVDLERRVLVVADRPGLLEPYDED